MYTLGLAHDLFISSAAIVKDGEVLAAIAEERLLRQKQFRGFPKNAIQKCLEMADINLDEIDIIAQGWNPSQQMEFPNARQSNNSRWRPEYLYSIPNLLMQLGDYKSGQYVRQQFDGFTPRIVYYDHQLAHAASAFYLSGYDNAAVFTADGTGERATMMLAVADSKGIHVLREVQWPHSLGLLYGTVTQFLGYRPDSDEWKVMALASFGEPNNPFIELLQDLIHVDDKTGEFFLDLSYFSFSTPEVYGGRFFTPRFEKRFGPPRAARRDDFEQRHYDIAYAVQYVFEEVTSKILHILHQETGQNVLVAAGGSMMNSVYNGKILEKTPFTELFVPPCPDDSGISVGAALLAYHYEAEKPKSVRHSHNYWGPDYDSTIHATLSKFRLSYEKLDMPAKTGAELLAAGKLLGWYQGRMEFGQRALGNRSILLDPRREDGKDVVNSAVKYRESFRPFAPSILSERVHDYFYCDTQGTSQYMERVFVFREEVRSTIPAVVHVDGTGRLQTVDKNDNFLYYTLIQHFEELTGIPIVLNTSFNLNGEAIVCTPEDAIRTFFTCGLDVLILGDYLIRK